MALGKKEIQKRNSVMLRNGSSGIIEPGSGKPTGNSLAAAGKDVIGGIDNFRKYQMMMAAQGRIKEGSGGMAAEEASSKRSTSLLADNKKFPIKRTVTMNDNNTRKKTSKLS